MIIDYGSSGDPMWLNVSARAFEFALGRYVSSTPKYLPALPGGCTHNTAVSPHKKIIY